MTDIIFLFGDEYLANCRSAYFTFCEASIPIYDRNQATCLADNFFGRDSAGDTCSKIVMKPNFEPIFFRITNHPTSWIYAVATLT
jgi:hypothetical protein